MFFSFCQVEYEDTPHSERALSYVSRNPRYFNQLLSFEKYDRFISENGAAKFIELAKEEKEGKGWASGLPLPLSSYVGFFLPSSCCGFFERGGDYLFGKPGGRAGVGGVVLIEEGEGGRGREVKTLTPGCGTLMEGFFSFLFFSFLSFSIFFSVTYLKLISFFSFIMIRDLPSCHQLKQEK